MRDRVPLVSKVLLVTACVTFVSLAESAHAEPPPETTVQGRLLDPAGNPRVGPVDMRVRIFGSPAPASGEPTLYEEEHLGVALVDGIFDVALGAGSPLVGTFEAGLFAEANRYVEFVVNGETLSPRQPLGSGKSLIVEHIMFNQWWERSGEPMELLLHPLHSGPAWVTRRRYHGALDTPPRALVLPEDSAVSVPLRASNGISYKVFLYGRLVDAETASPP